MTNANDQRILDLKKKIAEKKEKLGKIGRFSPITNCQLELDGIKQQIQVLTKSQLVAVLVRLNAYKLSALDLGVESEYYINGYRVNSWMEDIRQRLDIMSKKDEEQKLKQMEAQLSKLLSEEKQVELQIDSIADLLND